MRLLSSKTISSLVGAYKGRTAFVLGGAPSLLEDVNMVPADSVFISANEHGCLLRRCDFIVCCDNIEDRLRKFKAPIISTRLWADYKLFTKPASNSGAMAAWAAWVMGCSPIVIGGVSFYRNGTYFHNHTADSTGLRVPADYHKRQWERLPAAAPGAPFRVASGPLTAVFPQYNPAELIDYEFNERLVEDKACGIMVEFLDHVDNHRRGQIAEIGPNEFKRLHPIRKVRKVPRKAYVPGTSLGNGYETIRGGSGLGDSIYLRPIVDSLIAAGRKVLVFTSYPDVFTDSGAETDRFTKSGADIVGHYTHGKNNPITNQWQDVCIGARVPYMPLTFSWKVKNTALAEKLRGRAGTRKIVLLHGGRIPMGRRDGFGAELLPTEKGFRNVMAQFSSATHFIVRVGKKTDVVYDLPCDYDLNGKTTVAEMLDVAYIADLVVAQCSFAIPMAEAFDKPLLIVWSRKGLESPKRFISAITPSKIFSKPTSSHVVDDWSVEKIREALHAICPV